MEIHHYEPETGEYVGSTKARPDPKRPREFLIPANCTAIKPPPIRESEQVVFDKMSGQWHVVDDYRGTEYYDSDRKKRTLLLGESPDPSWETDIEAVPISLSELRESKRQQIDDYALMLISAATDGVIDTVDEIRMLALIWPGLNAAKLGKGILLAKDIYVYAQGKKNRMKVADREQIEAYEPATDKGWPKR